MARSFVTLDKDDDDYLTTGWVARTVTQWVTHRATVARAAQCAESVPLEAELVERQRAGVLVHGANAVSRKAGVVRCRDLHRHLEMGALDCGEVLENLLGDAGEVPAITLRVHPHGTEEPSVRRRRPDRLDGWSHFGAAFRWLLAVAARFTPAIGWCFRGSLFLQLLGSYLRLDNQHSVGQLGDSAGVVACQPKVATGGAVVRARQRQTVGLPHHVVERRAERSLQHSAVTQARQVGVAEVVGPQVTKTDVPPFPRRPQRAVEIHPDVPLSLIHIS